MPGQIFFTVMVVLLQITALLFLFNLNHVLERLGALLPDETLRQETRQFTAINRSLLITLLLLIGGYLILQIPQPSPRINQLLLWIDHGGFWLLVFFALLPLAMTMALLWKTKEVILASVFGTRR
jgi:heme/copper-type cytochrome/quinol oxidase subunit 4